MAPGRSLPLPPLWLALCAASAAGSGDVATFAGECTVEGAGGACAETQVELAEEAFALDIRTELLQQDARLLRLPALAPASGASADLQGLVGGDGANATSAAAPRNLTDLARLLREGQNATGVVRQQSEAVSRSSEALARGLARAQAFTERSTEAEGRLEAARQQAQLAEARLEGYLGELDRLRLRRDNLLNETVMAQRKLDNLTSMHRQAANQYQQAHAGLPDVRGNNASAEATVRFATHQLGEAGSAEGSAQAELRREAEELGLAIAKLNKLNAELRVLEGKVQAGYIRSFSAAESRDSLWRLLLAAVVASSGALRAVATVA